MPDKNATQRNSGTARIESAKLRTEQWFHLRRAQLHDVEVIARAEQQLFPGEAWSLEQIFSEIAHRDRRYVVAIDTRDQPLDGREGPIIGYAGILIAGDMADLQTIGTLNPGGGVGRALLAWCDDAAREGGADRMLLEVREDNDRARAFYGAAGFEPIAVRPGYYRLPGRTVDAIVMEAELPLSVS